MFVGIALLVLIGIATLNTVRNGSRGILGVTDDPRGQPLPEFAVPDARGAVDADANVAQDDCATAGNPCDNTRTPACQIDPQGAIRVCDLFNRPLVLSFWFTRGADCLPTEDILDRLYRRYRGRVNFLSIDIRDDPSSVRDIVQQRGWAMPAGYDRDGAVSDIYKVGGCPTVAFAYPGGIFEGAAASVDDLTAPKLRSDVEQLLRQSRRLAEVDR
jgi:thiol-disulfide isomerase/thioredoxin